MRLGLSLVFYLFLLFNITKGIAQKAYSPLLGTSMLSPYEYREQQIKLLEAYCDSLENAGISDSSFLEPLLELSHKNSIINPLGGLAHIDKGIKLASRNGYNGLAAQFYTVKGNIFRYRGFRDIALEAYRKSLELLKEEVHRDLYVFAIIDIGNLYYDQKDYPEALRYYISALDSAMKLNLPYAQSVALNNLGMVYREKEMYELASNYFLQSEQVRLQNHQYGLSAHSRLYLVGLAYRQGKFEKGLHIVADVIDTMKRYAMYSELVDAYISKAKLLAASKQKEAAYEALTEAQFILLQHHMINKMEAYYIANFEVAQLNGRFSEADEYINKLIAIADEIDNISGKMKAYELRHHLYKKQGKLSEALSALEHYIRLGELIRNQEVDSKLLEMEGKIKFSETERELLKQQEMLIKQKDLIKAQQTKSQLFIVIMALGLAGSLFIAFLLIQYKNANAALRQSQRLIQAKTQEIESRNEELERSKKLIEKHLQAKTDFMSQMSHEIRTPMNSILGLTELLLHEAKGSEMLDKLQSIRYSADVLLVIINDILDLASIEEGKVILELVPTDLERIGREIINNLLPIATQKGISLTFSTEGPIPLLVYSDPTRLYQIILNLCSNAVKFTEAGEVHMRFKPHYINQNEVTVRFEIKDTGIGISKQAMPHIFSSFAQGSTEIHRKYGGTGLGLAITKKLVEMLGGSIAVDSQIGKGSTFQFELQFKIVEKSAVSEKQSDTATNTIFDYGHMRVLYVEDNLMNQKVMSLLLKSFNLIPVIANNGKEAIDILAKREFDLILMDFRMPIMDGFETTTAIRTGQSGVLQPNIPIVGVTADVFDHSANKALALGMQGILAKPLVKDKLIDTLRKYAPKQAAV
ncbi:MAG: ATP-binding protein [Bacteroidia bacterium]